jgi:hypothetical protein
VPSVVKMFLWRALNNLLLTRQNLFKKGVTSDEMCPICGLEEESVSHIIWECQFARDVWGDVHARCIKWHVEGRALHLCLKKWQTFVIRRRWRYSL